MHEFVNTKPGSRFPSFWNCVLTSLPTGQLVSLGVGGYPLSLYFHTTGARHHHRVPA